MGDTPAISIQHLKKYYGPLKALDGIHLEVKKGDFFGFLGPNGAGKTTTINVLTGLAQYEGDVRIFGRDIEKDYQATRRMIGLSPQEFNFDPFMTAQNVLVYAAGYFGIPRKIALERAHHLLDMFGLLEKKDVLNRSLSGGMKRKLTVARALIHQPRILILDEPTAGMDVELRHSLWAHLRELNKQGTTIFLTTHYIEEAEQLCNRIGIIHQGKIIACDDKKALMRQLSKETIHIELERPLTSLPQEILENGYDLEFHDRHLTVKCAEAAPEMMKILNLFAKHRIRIKNVDFTKESLETIFLRLTGA